MEKTGNNLERWPGFDLFGAAAFLLVVSIFSACGRVESPSPSAPASSKINEPRAPLSFDLPNSIILGMKPGDSLDTCLILLGEPDEQGQEDYPNGRFSYHYFSQGLEITFDRSSQRIVSLTVFLESDPQYPPDTRYTMSEWKPRLEEIAEYRTGQSDRVAHYTLPAKRKIDVLESPDGRHIRRLTVFDSRHVQGTALEGRESPVSEPVITVVEREEEMMADPFSAAVWSDDFSGNKPLGRKWTAFSKPQVIRGTTYHDLSAVSIEDGALRFKHSVGIAFARSLRSFGGRGVPSITVKARVFTDATSQYFGFWDYMNIPSKIGLLDGTGAYFASGESPNTAEVVVQEGTGPPEEYNKQRSVINLSWNEYHELGVIRREGAAHFLVDGKVAAVLPMRNQKRPLPVAFISFPQGGMRIDWVRVTQD